MTPAFRLEALVRRAETGGAAALLVASPGTPLLSTVRIADRLGLPVLSAAVPDLVELLHRLVVLIRAPEVERARTLTRVVQTLRARPQTVGAALAVLREVLEQPVALLAADGSLLDGEALEVPDGVRFDLEAPQRRGTLVLQPVTAIAWLASHTAEVDDWAQTTAAVLAVAEPAVRACLAAQQLEAERDSRFRAHLLGELLAGGAAVRRDVVERAVSAGWQLRGWHTGVQIGLRASGDDAILRTARVREALAEQDLTGPLVERGDGWTTWVTASAEPPLRDARRMMARVRRALVDLPASWGLHAGIGRPHEGIAGVAQTLAEARDAALLARTREVAPAVEHVDELGVSRLLLSWNESELMRAYADSLLAPVQDGELLHTLQVYLDEGLSVTATAAALGLHRNTVTARIGRLRELLDVDLDDADHRLALQLACRVLALHSPPG